MLDPESVGVMVGPGVVAEPELGLRVGDVWPEASDWDDRTPSVMARPITVMMAETACKVKRQIKWLHVHFN